jgi:hypothetical protein
MVRRHFARAPARAIAPSRRIQIMLRSRTHRCATPLHSERDSRLPLPNRAACAICHFMAMLDLPVAVQLDVPALGFNRPALTALPARVFSVQKALAFDSRGPPIA